MKGKALLCLALVTSMLLGVFVISPVSAPSTTMGVEPQSIVDLGLGPGSNFTVEIWVRNVADLSILEFHLGYDTSVLTATSITYGGIYGTSMFEWGKEIWDNLGWLAYSVSPAFGEPSFTGSGCAAIINFTVDSLGQSALDLYQNELRNSAEQLIAHEALDGYFRNALLSVTLARHSGFPEHHHYSLSPGGDEDSSNDLFAIVNNDGAVDTWVKVVFTVTKDGTGILIGYFNTTKMQLLAGAMYGHKSDARYKATFTPPSEGKYYVSAQCWADTNLDTVPDTPMGKIKTFSFSVIP